MSRLSCFALAALVLPASLVAMPRPAGAEPVSVWVVGDSTAQPLEQGFGALKRAGDASLKVRTLFKNSSGLLRTDIIDWPKTVREQLEHATPDVAVLTFGPNDAQGIVVKGKRWPVELGTEEWRDEYARRVRVFADLFLARGVEVYVLLQPFDPDKKHAPVMRDVDAALARSMDPKSPKLHLIDVPTWLEDAAKERAADAPALRNKDGIHLTFSGGKAISQRLEARILEARVTLAESK